MKKTINQQILDELKRLNKSVGQLVSSCPAKEHRPTAEVIVSEPETPGLIRVDMTKDMTAQSLFDECNKLFGAYSWYGDLSNITSDRHGDYTVYFKDVQEADEENKNKSANQLKAEGHVGITLEERLQLEIVYFKKYGKHLDIENWTLCTGSRLSVGSVPSVRWDSDAREVCVSWCGPGDSIDSLRSRSAVKIVPSK